MYGYPPLWSRPQGFSTLIHIILEQQVSLASARAAYMKLQEQLTEITPERLLKLSDDEMKACYFSRQKMKYARYLAEAIISNALNLDEFPQFPDDIIRQRLKQIKGIGDWTADIYLLFALQRTDIFPVGDLAMVQAFREIKKLQPGTTREEMVVISQQWSPHRSIATMLLWHYYIRKKGLTVES